MALSDILGIALRVLEFTWSLLIMALVGNAIAEADAGNPSSVNYTIFVSVFGMLTLFYLIPATFSEGLRFHPMLMLGLDILNVIFWFCAAVDMAAELDVHSCSNQIYLATNHVVNGTNPGNRGKRCRELQASTAFLWFGFAAFAGSAVLSGFSSRGGSVGRGGMRGPAMRQV